MSTYFDDESILDYVLPNLEPMAKEASAEPFVLAWHTIVHVVMVIAGTVMVAITGAFLLGGVLYFSASFVAMVFPLVFLLLIPWLAFSLVVSVIHRLVTGKW